MRKTKNFFLQNRDETRTINWYFFSFHGYNVHVLITFGRSFCKKIVLICVSPNDTSYILFLVIFVLFKLIPVLLSLVMLLLLVLVSPLIKVSLIITFCWCFQFFFHLKEWFPLKVLHYLESNYTWCALCERFWSIAASFWRGISVSVVIQNLSEK